MTGDRRITRDQLEQAAFDYDVPALKRHRWWQVFEKLDRYPKRYSRSERLDWVREHGHRDPADVLAAIEARAFVTEYPPSPMSIKKYLHEQDLARAGGGGKSSPWNRPAVLALVRELLAEGERACTCARRAPTVRRWSKVPASPGYWIGVCPECRGLEPGVVFEAERPDVMASAA